MPLIREALPGDAAAVAAIYNHYVESSCATFEEVAPCADEMARRMAAISDQNRPFLVMETDREIIGYAYGGVHKDRSAYRYTIEDSIYLSPNALGRGYGKQLLGALIKRCEELGYRQMIAVIGDSENTASRALHEKLGFRLIGVGKHLGFKFGRWIDIVYMQRSIGSGKAD